MNGAVKLAVAYALKTALAALEPAAATQARVLTVAHLSALVRFLPLVPVSDLIALATGRGSYDNALDLAEAGASIVARAFPPVAITAVEVKLALEALQFLLDAAGVGPRPFKIQGGVPAAFPPGGGPGPYRGR